MIILSPLGQIESATEVLVELHCYHTELLTFPKQGEVRDDIVVRKRVRLSGVLWVVLATAILP